MTHPNHTGVADRKALCQLMGTRKVQSRNTSRVARTGLVFAVGKQSIDVVAHVDDAVAGSDRRIRTRLWALETSLADRMRGAAHLRSFLGPFRMGRVFLLDSNAFPCSVEAGRLHKHYAPGRSATQSTPSSTRKDGDGNDSFGGRMVPPRRRSRAKPDQTGLAEPDVGFSRLPALRHQRQDTALAQGSYGSIDRAGREPEVK